MLEYIHSYFDLPSFFRLFGYVSFRAILATIAGFSLSFLFGSYLIKILNRHRFRESIRVDGPAKHQEKAGTPTMGGIIIWISLLFSVLLFGNFSNLHFTLLLGMTLAFATLGFTDDYLKIKKKNKRGISVKAKLLLTLLFAFTFCYFYYFFTEDPNLSAGKISYELNGLFVPFIKHQSLIMPIWLVFPFWMLIIVGSSHAVNLTDGLDGLAIGTSIIVSTTFTALAYISGTPIIADYLNLPYIHDAHEISIFLAALSGASLGFLWYNAPPAQVFMGDTGSLALGSAFGMTAIILKKELFFSIAGGVFVIEALSVILQVVSFKLRGKRLFRMSPIHHHFELKGWPESRVVIRFWLIGIILCLIAISTLRIQ